MTNEIDLAAQQRAAQQAAELATLTKKAVGGAASIRPVSEPGDAQRPGVAVAPKQSGDQPLGPRQSGERESSAPRASDKVDVTERTHSPQTGDGPRATKAEGGRGPHEKTAGAPPTTAPAGSTALTPVREPGDAMRPAVSTPRSAGGQLDAAKAPERPSDPTRTRQPAKPGSDPPGLAPPKAVGGAAQRPAETSFRKALADMVRAAPPGSIILDTEVRKVDPATGKMVTIKRTVESVAAPPRRDAGISELTKPAAPRANELGTLEQYAAIAKAMVQLSPELNMAVRTIKDTIGAVTAIYAPGGALDMAAQKVVDRGMGIEHPDSHYASPEDLAKWRDAFVSVAGATFPGLEVSLRLPGGPSLVTAEGTVIAGAGAEVALTVPPEAGWAAAAAMQMDRGTAKEQRPADAAQPTEAEPKAAQPAEAKPGEAKPGEAKPPPGMSANEMKEVLSRDRDWPGALLPNEKQPGVDMVNKPHSETWTQTMLKSGRTEVTHEVTGGTWVQIKRLEAEGVATTRLGERIKDSVDQAFRKFDTPLKNGESVRSATLSDGTKLVEKLVDPKDLHIQIEIEGDPTPARLRDVQEQAQGFAQQWTGNWGSDPGTFMHKEVHVSVVAAP